MSKIVRAFNLSCMVRLFWLLHVHKQFSYKAIIIESYRLSTIYTNRIGLKSKLVISKLNDNKIKKYFLYGHTKKKTQINASWECLEKLIAKNIENINRCIHLHVTSKVNITFDFLYMIQKIDRDWNFQTAAIGHLY